VVESFARHASKDDWLVIKHHPMDRGHIHYGKPIAGLISETGLCGRLHYVHDMHVPTLFDHCKGVVTANSTAGLQALDHELPIKTLGRAFYDKPGLTFQGDLDSFWTTPWKPDRDLYLRFRAWTIATTQINSSFYADSTFGSRPQEGLSRTEAPVGDSVGFDAVRDEV
jgi:capsular polysaccharide export protein